jgi:hypothetical protein
VPRLGKQHLLDWIAAVATRQRRAATPAELPDQPPLFTGEAALVLTYLAIQQKSWTIDKGDRIIERDQPVPAAALAEETHVSLRSVRRILARARQAGFLVVGKQGGRGRGRATVYRLVIPHPRQWRLPGDGLRDPGRRGNV